VTSVTLWPVFERRDLERTGAEKEFNDVAFVRLEPVELRGGNGTGVQPVDMDGIEVVDAWEATKRLKADARNRAFPSSRSPRTTALASSSVPRAPAATRLCPSRARLAPSSPTSVACLPVRSNNPSRLKTLHSRGVQWGIRR
jgi:hypothetical protein